MSIYSRAFAVAATVVAVLGSSLLLMAATTIPCSDTNMGLSPYVWKLSSSGADARAEATFPGAYFKTVVAGTTTIGVEIDGAANTGCPASSMPYIEYSVDDGPFTAVQLTQTGAVYTLPVATGLDAASTHKLEFYFRAADLTQHRWTASTAHLRIAGLALDDGGFITPYPLRAKKAIGYGDSITEGVGVDALFTSWQVLAPNNARCVWFPMVCNALGCEYGQIGSGGEGMVTTLEVPGVVTAWDHYDANTSRLQNGLLLPEPDYVFCCHGTNDQVDITSAYTSWLAAVRTACPNARVFCVAPPSAVHRSEISAAVTARNQAGDTKVHFIDVPDSITKLMPNLLKPSQGSYDGGHPTQYGQGVFGAYVAAKTQAILSSQ